MVIVSTDQLSVVVVRLSAGNGHNSAQAHHVLDELAPEEEETAERVAEVAIAGETDDPLVQIVVDLLAHLAFDFLDYLVWIGHPQVVLGNALSI